MMCVPRQHGPTSARPANAPSRTKGGSPSTSSAFILRDLRSDEDCDEDSDDSNDSNDDDDDDDVESSDTDSEDTDTDTDE